MMGGTEKGDDMGTWLASLGAALGVGFGSALIPLINAEAYAILMTLNSGPWWLLLIAAAVLATGQTLGKVVIFEASRRGTGAWGRRRMASERKRKPSRLLERSREWLRSPTKGPALVFASSSLGLPPLAAVSVAAGAAGQSRPVFAAVCFAGRVLRFGAIMLPAAGLLAR